MTRAVKNTICLWFNDDAEDAARFYANTFTDSSVDAVNRAPGDYTSGKGGDVLTAEFTVIRVPCPGLNGGSAFEHDEAFSFQVAASDQADTDRYWNAIVGNSGQESACGWCKDKWEISWNIASIALNQAITDPDRAAPKRAFDAIIKKHRIDIEAIDEAIGFHACDIASAAQLSPGTETMLDQCHYPAIHQRPRRRYSVNTRRRKSTMPFLCYA